VSGSPVPGGLERAAFRRRLARMEPAAAAAAVRELVIDPPAWAADWKVFGALWAMPGHSITLVYDAIEDGVVSGQTFGELSAARRERLAAWLTETAACREAMR
jgi:hypothetical protein